MTFPSQEPAQRILVHRGPSLIPPSLSPNVWAPAHQASTSLRSLPHAFWDIWSITELPASLLLPFRRSEPFLLPIGAPEQTTRSLFLTARSPFIITFEKYYSIEHPFSKVGRPQRHKPPSPPPAPAPRKTQIRIPRRLRITTSKGLPTTRSRVSACISLPPTHRIFRCVCYQPGVLLAVCLYTFFAYLPSRDIVRHARTPHTEVTSSAWERTEQTERSLGIPPLSVPIDWREISHIQRLFLLHRRKDLHSIPISNTRPPYFYFGLRLHSPPWLSLSSVPTYRRAFQAFDRDRRHPDTQTPPLIPPCDLLVPEPSSKQPYLQGSRFHYTHLLSASTQSYTTHEGPDPTNQPTNQQSSLDSLLFFEKHKRADITVVSLEREREGCVEKKKKKKKKKGKDLPPVTNEPRGADPVIFGLRRAQICLARPEQHCKTRRLFLHAGW
ncbi:hypothetical protein QBC41DRAFT_48082 [Cercophora samala]|uniref:Uncharacterized protein n=1 Tax=Cercophora samala TaxID=330535 RepID=A0AA39YV23_9PEZI|nr:hypothetical protein QBC41DRAFT_48082 [Cercophora samala]